MADVECGYSAGSLTGAIIGTFLATLVLLGIIGLIYKRQKRKKLQRSGLANLVIVEDGLAEKQLAFDNAGFIDDPSVDVAKKSHQQPHPKGDPNGANKKFNGTGKLVSSQDGAKKMPWGPLSFFFKSRTALDDSVLETGEFGREAEAHNRHKLPVIHSNFFTKTMHDAYRTIEPDKEQNKIDRYDRLRSTEPQRYNVALKGHDFTGLGFNICGNMKDGIFVKDLMQRGPASESKLILPGDQITSMTVSFKQMVLEDALTLLSYASPYDVSLDMIRHSEKSLSHKGLLVSTPTHPSGSSGQSNTLERVCHPFFKSQSIDDLRKVGKEHLDMQVSRVKKQSNGVHGKPTSSSITMEVPTVVVVGNNETRVASSSSTAQSHQLKSPQTAVILPNVNLKLGTGTGRISQEAHQRRSPPMDQSTDETDSPRASIVQGIKVVAKMSKPEITPRAKTKVTNVQKAAAASLDKKQSMNKMIMEGGGVVEAISPVVKMSAEFEHLVREQAIGGHVDVNTDGLDRTKISEENHHSAVIDVNSVQVGVPQPSIKVEKMDGTRINMEIPSSLSIHEKSPSMLRMKQVGEAEMKETKGKNPHVQIEMGSIPEVSINIGGGSMEESPVKKPQRGQKMGKDKEKEKADKNKEKEMKKAAEKEKELLRKAAADKDKEAKKAAAEKEMKKGDKDKDKVKEAPQGETGEQSGEKSKFGKFGFGINLPDISLNFGKGHSSSSSSNAKAEEKSKDKSDKDVSSKELEKSSETIGMDTSATKEEKPGKKVEKEVKDKSSKDKGKEMSTKPAATTVALSSKNDVDVTKSSKDVNEQGGQEKQQPLEKSSSSSGLLFALKLPHFDKQLLRRKDSSGSSSGEKEGEVGVDKDPNASKSTKATESLAKTSKGKDKEKSSKTKDKPSSRPTSPERQKETKEYESQDENDRPESADSLGAMGSEKAAKKSGGGGFHMPHLGIKLPKFGHSKQTYSFENAGEGSSKDGKGFTSEIPTSVEESAKTGAVKVEIGAEAPDFKKMTSASVASMNASVDEVKDQVLQNVGDAERQLEKKVKDESKMGSGQKGSIIQVQLPSVKVNPVEIDTKDVVDAKVGELEIKPVSLTLVSSSSPESSLVKDDTTPMAGVTKGEEMSEKEPKAQENKPGLVSKGLKGLRDLKDKVTSKLSHDNQAHNLSSSDDEGGLDGDQEKIAAKEKAKRDKKAAKEAREKATAEVKKEKDRIKAEKKAQKAEIKKAKKATGAGKDSSDSSSSSSDESDGEADGKDKKKSKSKDKVKSSKKAEKDKKAKKRTTSPSPGIPIPVETIEIEVQHPKMEMSKKSEIEMSQSAIHVKIPKPPVASRKSKESLKEEKPEKDADKVKSSEKKVKDKKSAKDASAKVGGGVSSSSSSSSSSSESDGENEMRDSSGKPKKPKRSAKRKAPVPPSTELSSTKDKLSMEKTPLSLELPNGKRMTIITSAEVSSPPKEIVESSASAQQMHESPTNAKTPESGRKSASFGDLSSLQQKPSKVDNLERAMSVDMAADSEQLSPTSSPSMPLGSALEDLSADPDSKVFIPHFHRQHPGAQKGKETLSPSSSSETLKAAPTSVVQIFPKESLTVVTHTNTQSEERAEVARTHQISIIGAGSEITTTTSTESPTVSVNIHQTQAQEQSTQIQKMMNETISMMNNIVHKMDSPSLVRSVTGEKVNESEKNSINKVTVSTSLTSQSTPSPVDAKLTKRSSGDEVTISTSGSSVLDKAEVERVAREAVDEIMAQINLTQVDGSGAISSRLNGKSSPAASDGKHPVAMVSVVSGSSNGKKSASSGSGSEVKSEMSLGMDVVEPSGKNITVMNIKNVIEQADDVVKHGHVVVGTKSTSSNKKASTSTTSSKTQTTTSNSGTSAALLRGDSKSRLMQTVADANTIKVNPISPLRKDSSMSSSSSSVDSSPEVRMEAKPFLIVEAEKSSSVQNNSKAPSNGQTIEISAQELDGIMMSHAEFLQKQAAARTPQDSLDDPSGLKDGSFDNWVYVEQKNQANELTCSHSHSDPEPSTSSSNDDDDLPYNRNGALSPTTYKMETEYKYQTSEMRVTSSPIPPGEPNNTGKTTVYSTTMTLPQKTVTQITLGEPIIDSNGRIVSKITLDSGGLVNNDGEEDLPKLQPMK